MKIKALRLRDFRNHKHTEIELDRINIFVGPNGAGKTSLRAAVEYALTGRVLDWTDRAGRGADRLVRLGSSKAAIELDTDRLGKVRREIPGGLQVADWTGTSTLQQERLLAELGADADAVSAALNTAEFLEMKPSDQKRLLFALAGVRFDAGAAAEILSAEAPKGLRDSVLEELGRALEPFENADDPPGFEGIENTLREMRRDRKKQLAAIQSDPRLGQKAVEPAIPPESVEEAKQQLVGLKAELGKAQRALGAAEERSIQRERLGRELARIEDRLLRETPPGPEPDLGKLEAALQAARDKEDDLRARRDELQVRAREAQVVLAAAEAQAKGAAGLRDVCPLVPGERVACPMSSEDRQALVAAVEADAKARRTDFGRASAEAEAAHKGWLHAQLAVKAAEGELEAARRQAAARGAEIAERDALRRSRNEVKAALDAGQGREGTDWKAAVAGLQARISNGEEMIRASEQAAGLLAWQAETRAAADKLQKSVDALEYLVAAMGPEGIPARLLRDKLDPIAARAKETLEALTGGEYSLQISASGGDLQITVLHQGVLLPASYLSTSERLRVGVVLQHVLNGLTGLGILLVDDGEILDPENRALFISTILEISDQYDTVMVLATRGDVEPRNPGIDGLAMFLVEGGQVRPLEEDSR